MRIGLLAAATTVGVIMGLGLRHDSAIQPFAIAGRALWARTTGLPASPLFATLLGFALHIVWMLLWGVCFSVVATPLRGAQRVLAAAVIAGIVGLLTVTIAPAALGAGAIAAQTGAQTMLLLALFALSLLAGIRLARVEQ
jgi:hypothetical protein